MSYKSNYEPYVCRPPSFTIRTPLTTIPQTSQSLDIKRAEELSSEELLNPLGSLYPHVVAL
jgi:hypothetical protein